MRLTVLHPLQAVMPRKGIKATHGDRLIFYGGIDSQSVVPVGTPDEVRAEVKDCIHTLGAQGGYVVGLSHTLT